MKRSLTSMFKFNFDLESSENDIDESSQEVTDVREIKKAHQEQPPPFVSFSVDELIEDLPDIISYSPLRIPLPGNRSVSLLRRDLFDARFQLISEDKASKNLDFIDAPSDILPGVYEGGLKIWECSVDLAGYLDNFDLLTGTTAKGIIEIGCGAAVPSLRLLKKCFSTTSGRAQNLESRTFFHLQDYNASVLQLMTLPNIILTWYASPASASYRAARSLPPVDTSQPGELSITPELISSFLDSLRERHIDIKFFAGTWADLELEIRDKELMYDLAVTSETIYQSANLPSLVSLLKVACTTRGLGGVDTSPLDELAQLSVNSPSSKLMSHQCLVAAKLIYFGVGGGVHEFEQTVKEAGGQISAVFEKKVGVGRRIMSIDWGHSLSK